MTLPVISKLLNARLSQAAAQQQVTPSETVPKLAVGKSDLRLLKPDIFFTCIFELVIDSANQEAVIFDIRNFGQSQSSERDSARGRNRALSYSESRTAALAAARARFSPPSCSSTDILEPPGTNDRGMLIFMLTRI